MPTKLVWGLGVSVCHTADCMRVYQFVIVQSVSGYTSLLRCTLYITRFAYKIWQTNHSPCKC